MATYQFVHPEKFDFTRPQEWEKWIQRFERFRIASGLVDQPQKSQVNSLIYCMGSEADDILDSLNLSAEQKQVYDTVTGKLKDYFVPKRNIIFERVQFNQRVQREGESVDSFVTSLHKLAENCVFGTLKNDLIRDRLVVGLRDSRLSEKLQLDAKLTLETALSQARQSEAVKKQQSVVRGQTLESVDAVKTRTKWPKKNKQTVNKSTSLVKCKRCGRENHPRDKCPAKDSKCHKCSVKGHWAKFCLAKSSVNEINADSSDDGQGFLGSVESHESDQSIGSVETKPWITHVRVDGVEVKFKVDSGADVTVISEKDLQRFPGVKLVNSTKVLCGPGNSKLDVLGKFQCTMETDKYYSVQDVYVVRGLSLALLGRPAIESLRIIGQVNLSSVHVADKYKSKFPKLFKGLGKTDWEYTIKLDSSAQPYSLSVPRRVSLPLMDKVKAELQRMQDIGVVSKVDEPTPWCSGMVAVPKANSDQVRICVDLTKLNESVIREKHMLPTVEESLSKLAGGRYFTKIDQNCGFWQVRLNPESRLLTTFITPFGRYCFNRLPMGISSASEYFQKKMSQLLEGIPGVVCQTDDCLISGETLEQHDERVFKVLERLESAGITLNQSKCVFAQRSLTFLGHLIDEHGIRACPEKVRAITEMATPQDIHDIRRFLGMVNQLAKFSRNIAEKSKPLRDLLSKKNAWSWGPAQESAFNDIKQEISSETVLAHYDPNKEILLSADSSSFGLGSLLRQKHGDVWKPVAFASRSLSETECRYAQIEKEALAVTWACEKFSNFLIGTTFHVETDHKPLVPLLSTKDLSDIPPRIQRFKMRLMRFHFSISHTSGKALYTADTLSRAPLNIKEESDIDLQLQTQAFVDSVVNGIPASQSRLDQVKSNYNSDEVCSSILRYCSEGWPEKSALNETLKPYWAYRGEFSVQDGLLLKGVRLVIPKTMHGEILEKLHGGHFGIAKCRERAKTSVWWLGLSTELENMVKSCQKCIEQSKDHAEPLKPIEFPSRPWQRIGADLFYLNGTTYLLVVDYFSRYVELAKIHSQTSASIINHLKPIMASHGICEYFHSDGGKYFTSNEFKEFAMQYDFKLVTSSPKFAQSNGMIERHVGTIKDMLKKADDPYLALLSYRSLPLHNGFSPSQLCMGRNLRTPLPVNPKVLDPNWPAMKKVAAREKTLKHKQKYYHDKRHRARLLKPLSRNQNVWVKDQKKTGIVRSESEFPRSYHVQTDQGIIRRNRRFLSTLPENETSQTNGQNQGCYEEIPKSPVPFSDNSVENNHDICGNPKDTEGQNYYVTRSGRCVKPPDRLTIN